MTLRPLTDAERDRIEAEVHAACGREYPAGFSLAAAERATVLGDVRRRMSTRAAVLRATGHTIVDGAWREGGR